MTFTSTITQKGQATIPIQIRQLLGLKSNMKIVFEITSANEVSIKPVPDFFALKGSVKTTKPFNLESMEKAVGDAIVISYDKKRN